MPIMDGWQVGCDDCSFKYGVGDGQVVSRGKQRVRNYWVILALV